MAKVSRFLRELGRRRVVRTVIAYVVVLWALSQGAADLFPAFGLPDWSLRAFIIGGVAAIPLVALLSWRFDITPRGIVSDPFGDPGLLADEDLNPTNAADWAKNRHNPTDAGYLTAIWEGPDGQAERHLWADSFEGALEDILDLHGRVARAVSSAVRATLTPDEAERLSSQRKVDPAVYETYLRAKHLSYVSAAENRRGIRLYEQVIARDPEFAPAYAGMARNLVYLATLGAAHFQDVLPRAADAARRAMALDADSGEARSIHGYVSLFHDWDWRTAGRSLEQAREMEPNNVAVLSDSILFLALTGAPERAVPLAERAVELDPMSATTLFWKGWALFVAERFPEAVAAFGESIELDPEFPYPVLWTGSARGLMGQPQEALIWARRAEALDPESNNTDFIAVLAATYVMGDSPADARRQLERVEFLERDGRSFWPQRSYIHGWLGEYETAADLADRAFGERNPGVIFWANHPVCDASRAHPRIMENLKALGFPAIRPMRPWQPRET